MIVVDASVLVAALIDDGADGTQSRVRLRGETLLAPSLIDLEFVSVLRRLVAAGKVLQRRAELALADLLEMPLMRVQHVRLLPRCWDLRGNLTPYDAAYVALAELADAVLVTADRRLARAPGLRCQVEVLGPVTA